VTALAIPNDVYLTYSLFILTSVMRVTIFPLHVRSEPHVERKAIAPAPSEPSSANISQWLTPVQGVPVYISLLGTEPYTPPTLLSNPSGLPSAPKLSLPTAASGSKELVLTPDTLRFLGKTVGQITSQVSDIMVAYTAAAARVSLQKAELSRLCGKCKDMETLSQSLRGEKKQSADERISRIQETQKKLLARFDRLLQALMEKASPELSEHETKWFEELKRMKQDVLGKGKYDEDSLITRTQLVWYSIFIACLPLILFL